MPRDTSSATLSTTLSRSGPSRRTQSYTEPLLMYSNTMQRLGLRVQAPMNWTTFLCRTWRRRRVLVGDGGGCAPHHALHGANHQRKPLRPAASRSAAPTSPRTVVTALQPDPQSRSPAEPRPARPGPAPAGHLAHYGHLLEELVVLRHVVPQIFEDLDRHLLAAVKALVEVGEGACGTAACAARGRRGRARKKGPGSGAAAELTRSSAPAPSTQQAKRRSVRLYFAASCPSGRSPLSTPAQNALRRQAHCGQLPPAATLESMWSCEMSISQSSGAGEPPGTRFAHAPGPTPPPPSPLPLTNPGGGGSCMAACQPDAGPGPAPPSAAAAAAAAPGSMFGPLLWPRPRAGMTGGGMRSNRWPSCSSRLSPACGDRGDSATLIDRCPRLAYCACTALTRNPVAGRCFAKSQQGPAPRTSVLQPSTTNTSSAKASVVLNTWASRMLSPRSPCGAGHAYQGAEASDAQESQHRGPCGAMHVIASSGQAEAQARRAAAAGAAPCYVLRPRMGAAPPKWRTIASESRLRSLGWSTVAMVIS